MVFRSISNAFDDYCNPYQLAGCVHTNQILLQKFYLDLCFFFNRNKTITFKLCIKIILCCETYSSKTGIIQHKQLINTIL